MAIVIGDTPKETKDKSKTLDVTLVGKKYKLRKLKGALAMRAIHLAQKMNVKGENAEQLEQMDKALDELILRIFGKAYHEEILERLYEPSDDLDIEHIASLLEALMVSGEEGDGNPTG